MSAEAVLIAALEQIAAQQQETLRVIERNGFVFDSIGNEPGNWQHLAFTIYTDLCRVDSVARAALCEAEELRRDESLSVGVASPERPAHDAA
jgi:hypothetical protein